MAVSDRIPAVTGNRSGMWRGAQALRRLLKLSGPSGSASSTGRSGLVREGFLEAAIPTRPPIPIDVFFPCRNKGFAVHKLLQSRKGDVVDKKESFPI